MSYSNHGIHMIPFIFIIQCLVFSVFGIYMGCWRHEGKGFLLGGTAGRTTLNGEGLQHQDGHSQFVAASTPNIKAYDIAFL